MAKYRLAKGTSSWLGASWAVTLLLVVALALTRNLWLILVIVPALAVSLVLLNFFRDPDRIVSEGIVAPADGVIQFIEETEDGGVRIATFMNPFNVHVNRAPLAGRVLKVEHIAGGFIPAFNKESERNERVVWDFETEVGEVRLVQIAGALARRIVPYLHEGEKVLKGDRIGIIRLGSRVDLYLPPGLAVKVKVGEKVRAGETVFAALS